VKGSFSIDGYLRPAEQNHGDRPKATPFEFDRIIVVGGVCIVALAIVLILAAFTGCQASAFGSNYTDAQCVFVFCT
jgi:hypothetical protein